MHINNINWENGTWENRGAGKPALDVAICGDWAPIRDFSHIILNDPNAVYGNLLSELEDSDLRIVNLECPLVDRGTPVWKSGAVLKGVADHVRGLTTVPFDVAAMANNHVFDYGPDAFVKTKNLLSKNNIQSLGAGLSVIEARRPLITSQNGLSIGIVNFSEGEDLTAAGHGPGVFGWEVDRVIQSVKDIKPRVNAVIVICHGGVEYIPFPPPYLASAFQQIADEGADLVIGHHPHVPQGIHIHHGVPICYSLGNFVFFQHTDLLYRKIGYMIKAQIHEKGVSHIRIIPYEILWDRLNLLTGEALRRFFQRLKAVSEPLKSFNHVKDAWHGFIKYYGISGFKNEMHHIMDTLEKEAPKGAAMFRNRLTTLQHSHHLMDTMTRIMEEKIDQAPDWALDLTVEWMTKKQQTDIHRT